MNREKPPRISIQFSKEDYKKIEHIAKSNHTHLATVVRDLTKQSLDLKVTQDNLDMISKIIRKELKAALSSDLERLFSIITKSTMMSATSAYLNAEAINNLVPIDQQEEVQVSFQKARLKGLKYINSNNDISNLEVTK